MPANLPQKFLDQLMEVIPALAIHIAGDVPRDEKINAMYKLLVIGNGEPPIPETIRIQQAWILAHDALVVAVEQKAAECAKESRMFKRQMIGLFVGEVLTLLGLAASTFLRIAK